MQAGRPGLPGETTLSFVAVPPGTTADVRNARATRERVLVLARASGTTGSGWRFARLPEPSLGDLSGSPPHLSSEGSSGPLVRAERGAARERFAADDSQSIRVAFATHQGLGQGLRSATTGASNRITVPDLSSDSVYVVARNRLREETDGCPLSAHTRVSRSRDALQPDLQVGARLAGHEVSRPNQSTPRGSIRREAQAPRAFGNGLRTPGPSAAHFGAPLGRRNFESSRSGRRLPGTGAFFGTSAHESLGIQSSRSVRCFGTVLSHSGGTESHLAQV